MTILRGLYGITDPYLLPTDDQLFRSVEKALDAGLRVLQYRDKTDDWNKKVRQSQVLRMLCHQYQAVFIINDDVNLALEVEADGIHIGQSDLNFYEARKRLGEYALIGVSAENSADLAQQAYDSGADYIALGAFYKSITKPDAPLVSLDTLSEVRKLVSCPIVVIGGINLHNASSLIVLGANMVAVVHDLFSDYSQITNKVKAYNHLPFVTDNIGATVKNN